MSAPIDDLLFGGDDSADEDSLDTNVPLESFGAPLAPGGALPIPIANSDAIGSSSAIPPPPSIISNTGMHPILPPASITPNTAVQAPLTVSLPMNVTSGATTTSQTVSHVPSYTPAVPQSSNKSNGSGPQTFQQMFALLKQMLPPEQYATLHAEMRKGNGNDVKSIVDIIKRIAGEAVFSTVVQKMDLTRAVQPNLNASKKVTESYGGEAIGVKGTNIHGPTSFAKPVAASSSTAGIAAVGSMLGKSMSQVGDSSTMNQRSTLTHGHNTPNKVASIKTEPGSIVNTTTNNHAALPNNNIPAANNMVARNEALEKIEFAKKLLLHASQCSLPPGICQVKKCDDVRRVFRHSATCRGARGCSHCEQLKGLVRYHCKECIKLVHEHCVIPFCDALRQANASSSSFNNVNQPHHPSAATEPIGDQQYKMKKGFSASGTKSPKAVGDGQKRVLGSDSAISNNVTGSSSTTKPKPVVNANITAEYGRLLQLILHVQKCNNADCSLGEECSESKTLLCQINSPNAPDRAKTYKQVFAHYKVCLAKNNTANCPMCKIGLRPIFPPASNAPGKDGSHAITSTAGPTAAAVNPSTSNNFAAASPSQSAKRTSIPNARSPTKRQRPNNTYRKTSLAGVPGSGYENVNGSDLEEVEQGALHREADVLTHTSVDLNAERCQMLEGSRRRPPPAVLPEQLSCKKEEWATQDLFQKDVLHKCMERICARKGVALGRHTTDIMSYALYEYLKQSIEEMVEISKQRCDMHVQTMQGYQHRAQMNMNTSNNALCMQKPVISNQQSLDVVRSSCENAFNHIRQEDLLLRNRLLEEAKRDEASDRDRIKKRKKIDRKHHLQDEKDETELDIEDLAEKDLRERLLHEDREGMVKIEGRVNESISGKFIRCLDNQVTMEDATFWLQNQIPYLHPHLFLRAEAARVITKTLP